MGVIRVKKEDNYTTMCNYHFKEKGLSLKAKGLLSWMLSLPDDWDYSIKGMSKCHKDGEDAITSALRELKEFGYLEVVKLKPGTIIENTDGSTYVLNRIDYDYVIHERPINPQDTDFQYTEKSDTEFSATENQCQINTKEENTKYKENTKEKAPAEPDALLDEIKSAKHKKMVYREQRKLSHELSDGDRYIAEQISNQKKERKAKSEEDKARARINKTEFSDKVKDLLIEFFLQSYHSDSDRRMKSAKDLEGKFIQLRNLIEQGYDAEKVVQQSIDQKWNAFYYLQKHPSGNKSSNINVIEHISDTKATEEQIKYLLDNDGNPDMIF